MRRFYAELKSDAHLGCSGEPGPEPGDPMGSPFAECPAPALRRACAAVGEPGGALVWFSVLLGLFGLVCVGAIPVVEAEPSDVAPPP